MTSRDLLGPKFPRKILVKILVKLQKILEILGNPSTAGGGGPWWAGLGASHGGPKPTEALGSGGCCPQGDLAWLISSQLLWEASAYLRPPRVLGVTAIRSRILPRLRLY